MGQIEIIEKLKKDIENNTNNIISIKADGDGIHKAYVDFPSWFKGEKDNLPTIIYEKDIDQVHLLHELLHLKNFFIGGYSLIVSEESLHPIMNLFKNIPEDYVVHKEIKNKYKLNPIEEGWFRGKDNLQLKNDLEVTANLVNYWAFSEFFPNHRTHFNDFLKKAKRNKIYAYLKAESTIRCLESLDYKNVSAYNKCTEEIVKIFAPDYYKIDRIYPVIIKKDIRGHWQIHRYVGL